MGLLLGGIVNGLTVGVLYSLIGFAAVVLYKSTGVANFALGVLATTSVFAGYQASAHQDEKLVRVAIAVGFAAVLGAVVYLLVLRPNESVGHLNLTVRTFGIYLAATAALNATWAVGQPFQFPTLFSLEKAFSVGDATVTWNTVGSLAVAAILILSFVAVFRYTDIGLLFVATAARPEISRLLGVKVKRLTLIAWVASTMLGACVGLLIAPTALLSSDMLEPYLLLGFSAAVIGGLTSLYGVLAAGIGLGLISTIANLYLNTDLGALIVFAILLLTLVIRPYGLFGTPTIERL